MLAPLLALCSLALAGDLYVNGVKATGLRGQTFDNADVRIDDSGDIHITAPNYVVRTIDPLPATIRIALPVLGAIRGEKNITLNTTAHLCGSLRGPRHHPRH